MRYLYQCDNEKCKVKEVIINKPMVDSSRIELCSVCGQELTRQYNTSIVTGDGCK